MPVWKILEKSVIGTSHGKLALPCQDSCTTRQLMAGTEPVLIAAVADGAGSASHSDIGSRLACEGISAAIECHLLETESVQSIDLEAATALCASTRNLLVSKATELAVDLRELACTLLVAIVGPSRAVFFQIGDGAIVFSSGSGYRVVFWPDRGEYANLTHFLTQSNFYDVLAFEWREEKVNELALLSDGLQMVALSYRKKAAHQQFFDPMFKVLRSDSPAEELLGPFATFLNSARVNERTDDDKTLVLAVRDPQNVPRE